ncbi:MAG TPA: GNAT family protein [Acidimicrobiales bacterium]|nr:GNAT family protein [Acidimicrobiales bacterium]
MHDVNQFGQPVGVALGAWAPPAMPSPTGLTGDLVQLEPLDRRLHTDGLFAAFAEASPSLWTYMAIGPFQNPEELTSALDAMTGHSDRQPYAITLDSKPVGFASYLRVDQQSGVLEIGSIAFSPSLQRTTAATEALYLMIDHCFDLGYRRCEWKCDDLNAPSRSAAERLGFLYEGTFRQATHYKGRNRDTAWFAITDADWEKLRPAFKNWLSADNFVEGGGQRRSLRELAEDAHR